MKTYQKLWDLGKAVRQLDAKFDNVSYLVFLYVCNHEGTCSTEIQKDTGIPQSTVSRAIAYLSGIGTDTRNPLHLIELKPNPEDRRQQVVNLTSEGKAFIKTLRDIVEA